MPAYDGTPGDLVACNLRCSFCQSTHVIALPGYLPMRAALLSLTCPTCHRTGPLQLARPVPPPPAPAQRIGIHEEPPDDLGDEQLLERRIRRKP